MAAWCISEFPTSDPEHVVFRGKAICVQEVWHDIRRQEEHGCACVSRASENEASRMSWTRVPSEVLAPGSFCAPLQEDAWIRGSHNWRIVGLLCSMFYIVGNPTEVRRGAVVPRSTDVHFCNEICLWFTFLASQTISFEWYWVDVDHACASSSSKRFLWDAGVEALYCAIKECLWQIFKYFSLQAVSHRLHFSSF